MIIVYLFSFCFVVTAIFLIALLTAFALFGHKNTFFKIVLLMLKEFLALTGYFFMAIIAMDIFNWLVHLLSGFSGDVETQAKLVSFICYLIGSIPFGYIITHKAGLGDIRKIGSGNIGATNVLRTGNKKLAALTLFLDGIKGTVAVYFAYSVNPMLGAAAGIATLLGHLYPIWLKFKGGKGVATTIGILLAISWPVGVAVMLLWLITAFLFRYSSLAALVSIGFSPVIGAITYDNVYTLAANVILAGLVFFRHKDNVRRLLNRTEPKIGQKEK